MVKRSQLKVGMKVEALMLTGEWIECCIEELPDDPKKSIWLRFDITGKAIRNEKEIRLIE